FPPTRLHSLLGHQDFLDRNASGREKELCGPGRLRFHVQIPARRSTTVVLDWCHSYPDFPYVRALSPAFEACLQSRAPLFEVRRRRESAKVPERVSLRDTREETRVDLFDHGDRAGCERCSALRHADAPCAGVGGVDFAVDQALPFKCAEDL